MKIEQLSAARFHPSAECLDCARDWPAHRGTRELAKSHARINGHRVRIIVEDAAVWGPAL